MLTTTNGAFSSFSTNDIAAARAFYADTLGITVREEMGSSIGLDLPDSQRCFIYPKDDHRPATFTVLNLEVPDIDRAVDELVGAGVRFERYERFDQDERGILREAEGPAIAWFKDPGGNILSIIQA